MKIARILTDDEVHYATPIESEGKMEILSGNPFEEVHPTGRVVSSFALLAPIVPSSILCIGLNYRRHAEEMRSENPRFPILFFKNKEALLDPGKAIRIPRKLVSSQVDFEGELAVILGKSCRDVSRERALEHVLGYTVANDVSARDWQRGDRGGSQWCRSKSFDTFAPMGPWIVTRDEIPDPHCLRIRTRVNGEILQDSNTVDMIFKIPELIEFLSADTTLASGTVILTGTPEGVGMGRTPPRWLHPGERVEVEIERIGVLSNAVA